MGLLRGAKKGQWRQQGREAACDQVTGGLGTPGASWLHRPVKTQWPGVALRYKAGPSGSGVLCGAPRCAGAAERDLTCGGCLPADLGHPPGPALLGPELVAFLQSLTHSRAPGPTEYRPCCPRAKPVSHSKGQKFLRKCGHVSRPSFYPAPVNRRRKSVCEPLSAPRPCRPVSCSLGAGRRVLQTEPNLQLTRQRRTTGQNRFAGKNTALRFIVISRITLLSIWLS